ncbi:MAG: hypothetical protein A2Z25_12645 [Planctomycetes bacterium RBG_16_55_9]|nr:MAG: hypothetical protein A2Z25_12645 [Planctomycetes bacterium RBG_16_55_9]
MSTATRVIIIVVFVSAVLAAQSNTGNMSSLERQQAIEKAVLKTYEQMNRAEINLDADKFFSYILDFDKGLIIQDGRLFKTRQEAYEIVKEGFEGVSHLKRVYEQTYVTVISPETALLTARGTSTVTLSDGRELSGPFAASLVYVLRDGQWKVLHGHYSIPNQR